MTRDPYQVFLRAPVYTGSYNGYFDLDDLAQEAMDHFEEMGTPAEDIDCDTAFKQYYGCDYKEYRERLATALVENLSALLTECKLIEEPLTFGGIDYPQYYNYRYDWVKVGAVLDYDAAISFIMSTPPDTLLEVINNGLGHGNTQVTIKEVSNITDAFDMLDKADPQELWDILMYALSDHLDLTESDWYQDALDVVQGRHSVNRIDPEEPPYGVE